jgi:PAS domain S-box-containing protein
MTMPIDGKVAGAFSIALLSVGLLGSLAYTSMTKFTKSTQWAAHAQEVLAELDDVPLAMERAEGAQLRYLLTDDENYLVAYHTAASSVEKELDEVRQLTADNPVQRDRVTTLTTLTKQRLASLQEALTTQDTEGADEALDTLMTNGDTATEEDIHKVIQDMETEENQLLAQHEAAATTHARNMRRLTVAVSTLAFLLVGLAGVLLNRDVLRRRRAEAALRESEAQYRTLVESTKEGLVSITLDGKIAAINYGLEMMLDWSREELVGQSYRKILTPISASQSEERLRHALAVERLPSVYEAECVRKDGGVVPVEIRASFLRDGTGQIQGMLALHHDISVKKALEQSYSDSPDSLPNQRTHQNASAV